MSEITPINSSSPVTGLRKVERDQRERHSPPKLPPKPQQEPSSSDEPPPHVDEIV